MTHSPSTVAEPPAVSRLPRPPFLGRLWRYQKERFPLAGYLPMVAVFTFSAAAYSRLARGAEGFIPLPRFAVGVFTALAFFFLLRVLDEHKDAATDRRYRPELPVPRGLVTLGELRTAAGVALALALLANLLVAQRLVLAWVPVLLWAALMTREFFVPAWLRARPAAYLLSHMLIMPMIDGYTTGLDWLAEGISAPAGLALFLLVTFLNGIVIEIGRKLRAPGDEREGVDTYTAAWGVRNAPAVWLLALVATAATAAMASAAAGGGSAARLLLAVALLGATAPAVRFLRVPSPMAAAWVERASGLWTLAMYLLLGAGPFVARALEG